MGREGGKGRGREGGREDREREKLADVIVGAGKSEI